MEKTISIRNTEITFSIWDLGGKNKRRERGTWGGGAGDRGLLSVVGLFSKETGGTRREIELGRQGV